MDGPLKVQWAMERIFSGFLSLLPPLRVPNEAGCDAEDPQREMGDVPGSRQEAPGGACGCRVDCLEREEVIVSLMLLPRSEGPGSHLHDNAEAVEVGLGNGGGRHVG